MSTVVNLNSNYEANVCRQIKIYRKKSYHYLEMLEEWGKGTRKIKTVQKIRHTLTRPPAHRK